MGQKQMIIQYMNDFGSITPWQAFTDLGCTKLATRISELIRDGVEINKKTVVTKNRYGKRVFYTSYSLGGKDGLEKNVFQANHDIG